MIWCTDLVDQLVFNPLHRSGVEALWETCQKRKKHLKITTSGTHNKPSGIETGSEIRSTDSSYSHLGKEPI